MKALLNIAIIALLLTGCTRSSGTAPSTVTTAPYAVTINPADFVAVVDNPYFPLLPGSASIYEAKKKEGLARVESTVLRETKVVMGIKAVVVHVRALLDGQLIEENYDWYAQDKQGTVWYLGEDVNNYEGGKFKDKAGSWEGGVAGALPGIIMYGNPAAHLGGSYRQEYRKGHAEDVADLLSVTETVTTPYGSFSNVVKTLDYSTLDLKLREHKYYAKGFGEVKIVDLVSGEELVALVKFTAP